MVKHRTGLTKPPKDGQDVPMGKPKRGRPPNPAKAAPGHNEAGDDERRALFLNHVAKRKRLLENKDTAVAALRNDAKTIRADTFTVAQVDFAIKLQTPEGEGSAREKLSDEIQAAKWAGSPIGTQFSFDLIDRTPAVDRAHDEGKRAAMEGKRASPPYDPSVPQHQEWLRGFHSVQDARVREGIKPVEAAGWGDRDPSRPLDA
jgi:hypothetical protein